MALPPKYPYGPPSKHILKSHGGDTDPMKFYSTQYGSTYGRKFTSLYEPRTTRHTGTGYLSNLRPGVYYSARLDRIDNPAMGHIVADNYASVTQKSFRPILSGSDGTEAFPFINKIGGSGFEKQAPIHNATTFTVNDTYIDKRIASAPVDIRPRHIPYLQKVQRKDAVERENAGYGPAYMSTEIRANFKGAQSDRSDRHKRIGGPREESGFTHNKNIEPVSFHPDFVHRNDMPAWLTSRPTGMTVTNTDFLPSRYPDGADPFQKMAGRGHERDDGFSKGTKVMPEYITRDAYDKAKDLPPGKLDYLKKNDPAEYLNAVHPNNHSSVAGKTYLGKPADPTEAALIGNTGSANKEGTGHVENNYRFVQVDDNPARFVTHYGTKFLDRTPKGLDRYGHTWGNTQVPKSDGFSKGTLVHGYGPELHPNNRLANFEPFQGRSMRNRDTFYDDHTHDHKLQLYKANTMINA